MDQRVSTRYPSPNADEHPSVTTYRHVVCEDSGRAIHAHDRVRVYPDRGPAGSYHYEYRCPDGEEGST